LRKVEKADKAESYERHDPLAIVGVEDISKMSVEEAIQKGILPTPIELAKSTTEIIEYGKSTGGLYGQALASIVSAFSRRDLPFEMRLAKGMRGLTFLMTMVMSAFDQYERLRELEDHVLSKKAVKSEDSEVEKLISILEEIGVVQGEEDKKKILEKLKEARHE